VWRAHKNEARTALKLLSRQCRGDREKTPCRLVVSLIPVEVCVLVEKLKSAGRSNAGARPKGMQTGAGKTTLENVVNEG
jgi:hypothetical protein